MAQITSREVPIVGIFEDEDTAREAVVNLKAAGFTEDHIGIVRRTEDAQEESHTSVFGDASGRTAALGAAVGASTGALWGLGILSGFLPGIGPAIAGGALGILLSNAAVGAAAAGLAGAFVGLGLSIDEAETYAQEVQHGKTLVTVKAGDRADIARTILSQEPMKVNL